MEDIQTQVQEVQGLPEDNHPIEKIPDVALLKLSREEVGKLNAYIDEFEYEIANLKKVLEEKDKLSPEETKEFRRDLFYKEVNAKINERNVIIRDLRKEN